MTKKTMTIITTDRLILRPLTLDDAEAAFEWTGDERVAKYMIYSTHESVETARSSNEGNKTDRRRYVGVRI